jgi:hypothetical protein
MSFRIAAIAMVLAVGCSRGPIVRGDVVRGGSTSNLSIRVTSSDSTLAPAPVDLVQVSARRGRVAEATPGQVFWAIAHKPGVPALRLPAVIQYGSAPEGYGSTGSAPILPAGDYEVRVNAGGVWSATPFRVNNQNVIE